VTGIIVFVTDDGLGWYGVRCVFRWNDRGGRPYEERITLWRAASAAQAIELAEREGRDYALDNGFEQVRFAQAYQLSEERITQGSEVFSLLRDSELGPEKYLDTFFDTGGEHQS
jgi:hypothetical protein